MSTIVRLTEDPKTPDDKSGKRGSSLLKALRQDCLGYRAFGHWWAHPGFWVVALYRVGSWFHGVRNPLLRLPLLACYWLIKQPYRFLLHVEIPSRAKIGAGLCLPHPYNIIIGDGAELGENCVIFHEVTIGRGPQPGLAKIGHHVVLFPGVRVLGGIVIGDRSEIGTNCVVMKSLPEATLAMQPAVRTMPLSLVRPN